MRRLHARLLPGLSALTLTMCSCTIDSSLTETTVDRQFAVTGVELTSDSASGSVVDNSTDTEPATVFITDLEPGAERVQQVAHQQYCPPAYSPIAGPIPQHFHPTTEADLRTYANAEPPWIAEKQIWADEYIYDGGDRANPVHYGGYERMGLDTEDAVAEFMDHEGETHLKPTNRVAIYSPRFGSVRTIVSPHQGASLIIAQRESGSAGGHHLRGRITSETKRKTGTPVDMRMRSRASGLLSEAASSGVTSKTYALARLQWQTTDAAFSFLQTGRFSQLESARLADAITAAVTWSREDSPIALGSTVMAQRVEVIAKAAGLKGLEDMRTPGDLRIVKLADRQVAKSGDVIKFSIRFDNVGDRELYHVQILDNLTPRLEYIVDSATSTTDGNIVVEDNQEGSEVLKFVLKEPLKGGEGGVVTFETRVR